MRPARLPSGMSRVAAAITSHTKNRNCHILRHVLLFITTWATKEVNSKSLYSSSAGLPREALNQTELRRWVKKPGKAILKINRIVRPPGYPDTGAVAYEPSKVERKWLTGDRKGRLCATASEPSMQEAAKVWLSYSAHGAVWAPAGHSPPRPTAEQAEVLSHFVVEANGHEYKNPIEPLHGIARHPFGLHKRPMGGCSSVPAGAAGAGLFDITYLVIHNDCGRQAVAGNQKPRVLLFDMGVSEGFKGIRSGIPATVSSGGGISPSMPLFYRLYQDRCLEPDAVFGWELNKRISATQWWGDAGPEIRNKVRFYEVPVMEGELHEAMQGKRNPNSFLQMLKYVAKPEDFVAVKLDIDTPAIEQTIVSVLTHRPDLASLIDEMFFEYHFYFDGLDFGWGGKNIKGDVDTALGTMHRLRALGIRAHFWI